MKTLVMSLALMLCATPVFPFSFECISLDARTDGRIDVRSLVNCLQSMRDDTDRLNSDNSRLRVEITNLSMQIMDLEHKIKDLETEQMFNSRRRK